MAIAVVVPSEFSRYRPVSPVYARRRMMVALSMATIALVLFVGAGQVVANRGGAPASASAIRPAILVAVADDAPAPTVYVVQSGDTLWSIGERFHGGAALADYVDALVSANGGTRLQVSQALMLPLHH